MPTPFRPFVQTISRRKALLTGVTAGGALLLHRGITLAQTLAPPAPCILTPELEEGPYYIASELLRRDIREGKPGLPLHLRIAVVDKTTCMPLPNAAVDIWHCDAMGIYSGYEKQSLMPMGFPGGRPPRGPGDLPGGLPLDENGRPLPPPDGFGGFVGFGGPDGPGGGPPHGQITDNDRFFRGVQISDAKGAVDFLTVYPGWYQGRDIHIHVKVHVGGTDVLGHDKTLKDAKADPERHVYSGGQTCFSGQIAFDDALTDRVAKLPPYNTHTLQRTRLDEDFAFAGQANDVILKTTQLDGKRLDAGVSGSIVFAVDPAELWKEQPGFGFDGPPGRGPNS